MPHKHNWIEVGRKTYIDRGRAMIMIMERCSICGKNRFRKERA